MSPDMVSMLAPYAIAFLLGAVCASIPALLIIHWHRRLAGVLFAEASKARMRANHWHVAFLYLQGECFRRDMIRETEARQA